MNQKIIFCIAFLVIICCDAGVSSAAVENNVGDFDDINKTLTIYDNESKVMTVRLISAVPDIGTFTEIFEVSNFEVYTSDSKLDFTARTDTKVGIGDVIRIEWFIEQNVSYVVNVTDCGIEQVEEITYNNKTGKNETVLINKTVITGYHDETRYKDVWVEYQSYDKVISKDQVQRIKVVYHKRLEFGSFRIQTIPMFRGVECLEMTWWNTSYDIRLKMPINNTAGAGVQTDFQVGTNISVYNANASSLRCYNRATGNIMSHWNETVVDGNVEELWTNNSIIASGWDNNTFCAWQTLPTVGSSSSAAATYTAFDDFERGNNGDPIGGDWTEIVGDTDISTDHAYGGTRCMKLVTAASSAKVSTPLSSSESYRIQYRVYVESAGFHATSFGNSDHHIHFFSSTNGALYYWDGSSHALGQSLNVGAWNLIEIYDIDFGTDTYDIDLNSVNIGNDLAMAAASTYNNVLHFTGQDTVGANRNQWIDSVRVRKYNIKPPVYESLELEYYISSLYYNTSPVLNTIYNNPNEYALNQTPTGKTNINDTVGSTGLSEVVITNYDNSASIVRNFIITGDDLDWYQVANLTGSYSMKNSSGTLQTVDDGNFTVNLVAGDYWIVKLISTPTPTPISSISISLAQYDELDLPLILYILMISMLYLFIAFRHGVAAVELSLIYLIFAFFFLLFQTVTMSVNYIYLTLFLLLFMISIAGITLEKRSW